MITQILNFVTPEEEAALLTLIPTPVRREDYGDGRVRLNKMYHLPRWLPLFQVISRRIEAQTPMPAIARNGHVRVNEYFEGQGLEMHLDIWKTGGSAGGNTAILSLSGDAILVFNDESEPRAPHLMSPSYMPPTEDMQQVPAPRLSLSYFDGDDFWKRSHGVLPVKELRHSFIFWRK